MSVSEVIASIALGFLSLITIVTILCAILDLEYEEFFSGIFMGLFSPFYISTKK